MSPRTLSSSHSQRAESGGRMSFIPLTATSLPVLGCRLIVLLLTECIDRLNGWTGHKRLVPGAARKGFRFGSGNGECRAEAIGDVLLHEQLELLRDIVPAQGHGFFPVDEH